MRSKFSFTLIELIFVIVIISIIVSFAIPKFSNNLLYTNITKIKSDYFLIQNGIKKIQNKNIIKSNSDILEKLDDAKINIEGELLFNQILQTPLISTNSDNKTIGKWIKDSDTKYSIYINQEDKIEFIYKDYIFKCDFKDNNCLKIQ